MRPHREGKLHVKEIIQQQPIGRCGLVNQDHSVAREKAAGFHTTPCTSG